MRSTYNLTALKDLVADILENLSDDNKAFVASTAKDKLFLFHQAWGTEIRDRYNLWKNPKGLKLKDIGKKHPD